MAEPSLSFCIKLKSKWITSLNIKTRYTEERVGNSLEHISVGDDFLIGQELKLTIKNWDLLEILIEEIQMAEKVKMFKILSHQRNRNQNYFDIPS